MQKLYFLLIVLIALSFSSKAQVVINEVYGGGGNTGATYTNDFIELYNNGSSPVSLSGWSVQYASASGTSWSKTNLTGTIPAKGYYLIQEAAGSGGTVALPTPDVTGTIALSATTGKVALVNNTTSLSGTCPSGTQIVDFVGFGTTANCFEGSGPTASPSNTTSVQRTPVGTDNNNNSADFTVAAPSPKNSAANDVTPPVVTMLSPANASTDVANSFTATITFSEQVQKGTGTIILKKTLDNTTVLTIDVTTSSVTVSGNTVSFDIQSLSANTGYYFQISSGAFKDLAGNPFSGLNDASTWAFSTGNILANYDFANCTSSLSHGFTQFSETGAITWACTPFGRDPNAPAGTAQAPNGVQINGFANGTNVPNVDWLISPSIDLTNTTYPLLSFWSRTAFNGLPLQLKVSTDYPGTGDPRNYTWTDLNGRFPAQASNSWTVSSNINLSAFKQPNVHVAFVYTSTDDDGARWTLDDISLINSPTPPPPSLTVGTGNVQFSYVSKGNISDKIFSFTGNDLKESVTLTATGAFLLSKDGSSFSSSLTYSVEEANNIAKTVIVRFAPTQADQNFTGQIIISTSDQQQTISVAGTSIDPATTLEVVNWNMEWFGSASLGPTNDDQQQENAQIILKSIGADIYGLVEVVDTARLGSIISTMPGYDYVVGQFGSHVNPPDPNGGPITEAQKLAFVYKKDLFSNITTRPLINNQDINSTSYNNWSSGRYPFLLTADVTLNGVTKKLNFVLVHAKANTSPTTTSYTRRQAAAQELHDTLMTYFPNENIIMLGDFNDDLDQSITAGFTATSYSSFTTDAANFYSPTLALSLAGKKSTVSYNDMIDHVLLSNEMQSYYMPGTATVLSDVASLVTNYGTTTTDHYPVFTRYMFCKLTCPADITVNADPDKCGAVVTFSPSATMTCGTVTATPASGSFFPIGKTVVEVKSCTGETCSFTVTVEDKEAPVITCPSNIVVNPATLSGTVVTYSSPVLSDNCGTPTLRQTTGLPSGAVFPIGTTTNSFEATDASGNISRSSFTVTVRDPYCDNNPNSRKVYVCHNGNTNCVSENAVQTFLNKGDKLGQCDWYNNAVSTVTMANKTDGASATAFSVLLNVYPNPFSKATQIQYTVPTAASISIMVYDLLGRERGTVFTGERKAGTYNIVYNADGLDAGVYYCRITARANGKEYVQLQKLIKAE
jgi:hypothetical protein